MKKMKEETYKCTLISISIYLWYSTLHASTAKYIALQLLTAIVHNRIKMFICCTYTNKAFGKYTTYRLKYRISKMAKINSINIRQACLCSNYSMEQQYNLEASMKINNSYVQCGINV